MKLPLLTLASVLAIAPQCFAPPPLVTGDVPTADKGTFEWYVGGRYQESETGKPSRLLPFTELVYGLSDRQELTVELAAPRDSLLADIVNPTRLTRERSMQARLAWVGPRRGAQ